MNIVYAVVMVLSIIGMIVCGKKQRTNPTFLWVAIVFFILFLACGGFFLRNKIAGSDPVLEKEQLFFASQGTKVGEYLKTICPGKKILLITNPGSETADNVRNLANALQAAYGGEVVLDTIQLSGDQAGMQMELYMVKAADFDAVVDKHSDCGIITTIGGLPQEANRLKIMKSSSAEKRPIVLISLSGPIPGLVAALQRDIISGVVLSKLGLDYKAPAPADPGEAFDLRYVLVTKENVEQYKERLSEN